MTFWTRPPPPGVRGLKVVSGNNDTTRITTAVSDGTPAGHFLKTWVQVSPRMANASSCRIYIVKKPKKMFALDIHDNQEAIKLAVKKVARCSPHQYITHLGNYQGQSPSNMEHRFIYHSVKNQVRGQSHTDLSSIQPTGLRK